jgi:hypothetical protein
MGTSGAGHPPAPVVFEPELGTRRQARWEASNPFQEGLFCLAQKFFRTAPHTERRLAKRVKRTKYGT